MPHHPAPAVADETEIDLQETAVRQVFEVVAEIEFALFQVGLGRVPDFDVVRRSFLHGDLDAGQFVGGKVEVFAELRDGRFG